MLKDFLIDEYKWNTKAILVSGNGAGVGKVKYYEGKFNAYQRTYVLTNLDENKVNLKYLYYSLDNSFLNTIEGIFRTGTLPFIKKEHIENFNIYLPSIDIQNKIVNILDTFDNYINGLTNNKTGLSNLINLNNKLLKFYLETLIK